MRPIGFYARCKECGKMINGFYNVMQGRIKKIKGSNPIQEWEFTCKECMEKEE